MDFTRAGQDLKWTRDTRTPHRSETNGMAERAVQRVRERTATGMVLSGLPCDGTLLLLAERERPKWPMARQHARRLIPFGATFSYKPRRDSDASAR